MTDDTGMLQHAAFTVPRYDDGYCLDDNARALLLMALMEDAGNEDRQGRACARVALSGVREPRLRRRARALPELHVVRSRAGSSECGSEDSHGRARVGARRRSSAAPAIRAGRASAGSSSTPRLPAVLEFTSPRAWAYALLGIDEYLRAFQGDSSVQAVRKTLAERLLDLFRRTQRPRVAVVRGPRHVLQCAVVAGADRVRRAGWSTRR